MTAFLVLKALAFDDRAENKDAADLVHVMRYAGDLEWVAEQFRLRRGEGKHAKAVDSALDALRLRFCGAAGVEGHLRDGPVACARFMHGSDEDLSEMRILEQRRISGMVAEFLRLVEGRRDSASQ